MGAAEVRRCGSGRVGMGRADGKREREKRKRLPRRLWEREEAVRRADAPAGPAAEQILQQATRASRGTGRGGVRRNTEPERMGGGLAALAA